jgi:prepilin-type N-terminal cleavage/methylation domain-containing protein
LSRAFTIVELLVGLVVLSVLLALTLPALSKARTSAKRLRCTVNMRSCALLVQTYGTESREALPFGGHTRRRASSVDMPDLPVGGDWGLANGTWSALFPEQWTGGIWDRALQCPFQPKCDPVTQQPLSVCISPVPWYWMSSALWLDAETVRPELPNATIRANTLADVSFTSDKAMFFEQAAFCNDDPESLHWANTLGQTPNWLSTVAYCDMSVHRVLRMSGREAVRTMPFDMTMHGVRGIDRPAPTNAP